MDNKIGILGFGGLAGRVVTEYLKKKYPLRCGQRRGCNKITSENIEFVQVDIHKEDELYKFTMGCKVIVNCIGPSYYVSRKIAIAAQKSGAYFIDIFGVDLLNITNELSNTVTVIGAGSVPGLSGILPLWLAKQKEGIIHRVNIYGGGIEPITTNACADVLLSMLNGFGKSNTYFKEGHEIKNKADCVFAPSIFTETAQVFEYFTEEMHQAIKKTNIRELHWYNIQTNPLYLKVMKEALLALTQISNKEDILEIADHVREKILSSNTSSELWYKIWIEMVWNDPHGFHTETIGMECNDTYQINGLIAVMCVERILSYDLKEGIYWPFEILDIHESVKKLVLLGILKIMNNDEKVKPTLENLELEEGEI